MASTFYSLWHAPPAHWTFWSLLFSNLGTSTFFFHLLSILDLLLTTLAICWRLIPISFQGTESWKFLSFLKATLMAIVDIVPSPSSLNHSMKGSKQCECRKNKNFWIDNLLISTLLTQRCALFLLLLFLSYHFFDFKPMIFPSSKLLRLSQTMSHPHSSLFQRLVIFFWNIHSLTMLLTAASNTAYLLFQSTTGGNDWQLELFAVLQR